MNSMPSCVYSVPHTNKGRVVQTDNNGATVEPVKFMLIHGTRMVEEYREPGFTFPADERPVTGLPPTPLQRLPPVDGKEHHNKVGAQAAARSTAAPWIASNAGHQSDGG